VIKCNFFLQLSTNYGRLQMYLCTQLGSFTRTSFYFIFLHIKSRACLLHFHIRTSRSEKSIRWRYIILSLLLCHNYLNVNITVQYFENNAAIATDNKFRPSNTMPRIMLSQEIKILWVYLSLPYILICPKSKFYASSFFFIRWSHCFRRITEA